MTCSSANDDPRPLGPIQGQPCPEDTRAARIAQRARDLYEKHGLLCAEAVVVALNDSLDGGLSPTQALALSAPFCAAMGESGCLCGALSGAVMMCGLVLGGRHPIRRRRRLRAWGRQLHDAFKTAHGSTCCRTLSHKVKGDPKAQFRQCADLTAQTAEMAARLILEQRPELVLKESSSRSSFIGGMCSRLASYWLR
ncbi:MAG: C-GCAxxG-C-C family protein [Desulfobacteraceae bacterium]|nr:C-GCAxxG-C-C family protein [Desulfobacteraceae bacterium]